MKPSERHLWIWTNTRGSTITWTCKWCEMTIHKVHENNWGEQFKPDDDLRDPEGRNCRERINFYAVGKIMNS